MATFAKSTFSHASYAAFRPTYPSSLFDTILSYHKTSRLARTCLCLDLGCGHGVATRAISPHFDRVLGTDPSPGMIAQAQAYTEETPGNVSYHAAAVENLSFVEPGTVDLVLATQAAHWFDFRRAWPELSRVLRPGGSIAFFGYKDHAFVDFSAATRVMHGECHSRDPELIGHYWQQPGRSIVEGKLRAIEPPEKEWTDVRRLEYEPGCEGAGTGKGELVLGKRMEMEGAKAYVRTWSSYHGWMEAHPGRKRRADGGDGDVVDEMFDRMVEADPEFGRAEELVIEWGSGLLMARKKPKEE